MIVCGGTRIRDVVDAGMCGMLTSIAGRGIPLGGICTGAYALMSSQLLDGYRCSIHWENRAALQDPFPLAQFADELFCVDRDRLHARGHCTDRHDVESRRPALPPEDGRTGC